MATSLMRKAEHRAGSVASAIRDLLAGHATKRALNKALASLQSEAAKVRDWRPADAALIDAELAGSIAGIASALYRHQPERPDECPRVPRPEDLLAVFDAAFARTAGGQ